MWIMGRDDGLFVLTLAPPIQGVIHDEHADTASCQEKLFQCLDARASGPREAEKTGRVDHGDFYGSA